MFLQIVHLLTERGANDERVTGLPNKIRYKDRAPCEGNYMHACIHIHTDANVHGHVHYTQTNMDSTLTHIRTVIHVYIDTQTNMYCTPANNHTDMHVHT